MTGESHLFGKVEKGRKREKDGRRCLYMHPRALAGVEIQHRLLGMHPCPRPYFLGGYELMQVVIRTRLLTFTEGAYRLSPINVQSEPIHRHAPVRSNGLFLS